MFRGTEGSYGLGPSLLALQLTLHYSFMSCIECSDNKIKSEQAATAGAPRKSFLKFMPLHKESICQTQMVQNFARQ